MNNVEIIESYFEQFFSGKAKHSEVREYLTDDFLFIDPLMSADSADDYIAQLQSLGDEFEMYAEVRKIIGMSDTVAALVDFKGPTGDMTYAQWFEMHDGKIARLEVVYDPRPFVNITSSSE